MSDWAFASHAATLGTLCEVDPDVLGSGTAADYEFEYIDIASVEPNKISENLTRERFKTAPSRARKKVRKGDVLLATVRPNLKSFAKVVRDGDFVASTGFTVLRAKEGISDPEFIKQSIFSDDVSRQIDSLVAGSNYPAITVGNVRRLVVPAPPLSEQRRIAEILSTLDEQIAQTEALVEKQRRVLDGLADSLLLGLGRGGCLADFADIGPKTGAPVMEANVPFVPMEVVSENGHLSDVQCRPWTSVASGFTRFKANDIIIAKITPCFENGKGAHIPSNPEVWAGSTEFHVLRAKPGVSARWLYWHTRTREFRESGAARMTGSAGQQRVPRDFLAGFMVRKASLEEQLKVAGLLDAADQLIFENATHLEKLHLQKQGLMRDLLTGHIRVKFES